MKKGQLHALTIRCLKNLMKIWRRFLKEFRCGSIISLHSLLINVRKKGVLSVSNPIFSLKSQPGNVEKCENAAAVIVFNGV